MCLCTSVSLCFVVLVSTFSLDLFYFVNLTSSCSLILWWQCGEVVTDTDWTQNQEVVGSNPGIDRVESRCNSRFLTEPLN